MTDPGTDPIHILMILDGWGINENDHGNAFSAAHTPFLDSLIKAYPSCRLACSGKAVGLPEGTMGNSEVGHMNIGAGRKVPQDFVRINTAIEDGSFFDNKQLGDLMTRVADNNKSLHFMGLLSDGGVHSHMNHLYALINMAKQKNIKNVCIHPILDGRDTSPTSGISYIRQLQEFLNSAGTGKIATIVGRYWAMDRDTRWDRVKKAYSLYTHFQGQAFEDPVDAVQKAYHSKQTDEFIEPIVIIDSFSEPVGTVRDGDGIVFFNFRADRAKEITRAFTQDDFKEFKRAAVPALTGFVCMTQYDETFGLPAAFGPQRLDNILAQVLSRNNIAQLRVAETEKYAHVTYFFNGGDENIFDGEQHLLIPSPRDVATYDKKPAMSAFKVAKMACEKIESKEFQFIILNFANMDMVGHTGVFEAAVKGCEVVDQCVKQVVETIWETGGTAIVTADHGNSEQMIAEDGSPHTAHTLNPVRLIMAGENFKGIVLKNGVLGDIAPTILNILNLDQPEEMTGTSLI